MWFWWDLHTISWHSNPYIILKSLSFIFYLMWCWWDLHSISWHSHPYIILKSLSFILCGVGGICILSRHSHNPHPYLIVIWKLNPDTCWDAGNSWKSLLVKYLTNKDTCSDTACHWCGLKGRFQQDICTPNIVSVPNIVKKIAEIFDKQVVSND